MWCCSKNERSKSQEFENVEDLLCRGQESVMSCASWIECIFFLRILNALLFEVQRKLAPSIPRD